MPPRFCKNISILFTLPILLIWPGRVGAAPKSRVISMAVGQVRDHVLTSREVRLNQAVEGALYADKESRTKPELESPAFAKQVTAVLLEWVVYLEAKSLAVADVSEKELNEAKDRLDKQLKGDSSWRELKVTDKEKRAALERKLQAKKLIRFRADSAVMPIGESEAQRYYEQNKQKFGSVPFETLRSNIKTSLARQQVERRLKDWFEVLQAKYKVRNFLSEI